MLFLQTLFLIVVHLGFVFSAAHVVPSPVTRSKPVPTNHQNLVVEKRRNRYTQQLSGLRAHYLHLEISDATLQARCPGHKSYVARLNHQYLDAAKNATDATAAMTTFAQSLAAGRLTQRASNALVKILRFANSNYCIAQEGDSARGPSVPSIPGLPDSGASFPSIPGFPTSGTSAPATDGGASCPYAGTPLASILCPVSAPPEPVSLASSATAVPVPDTSAQAAATATSAPVAAPCPYAGTPFAIFCPS